MMATTTPKAIIENIRDIIDALDPRGEAYGNGEYIVIPSWESRPEADVDRCFAVHDLERGAPQSFGVMSEYDYDGTIRVTIGHSITSDEHEGLVRRDTDLFQIAEVLEKSSNFPSGVSLVRLASQITSREDEDFWKTVLVFELFFSLAAP